MHGKRTVYHDQIRIKGIEDIVDPDSHIFYKICYCGLGIPITLPVIIHELVDADAPAVLFLCEIQKDVYKRQ